MKKHTEIKNSERKSNASISPTSVADDGGRGKGLQLYIPHDLYKSLKQAALDRETTVRAVVLAALKKDGFNVKSEDLKDRRT
jgi:hypothetical protein